MRRRSSVSAGRGLRLFRSRLPFPVLLALRYLRSTRRDAFTTFLSVVAVGAITVGVAALILSLSALAGFQSLLRSEVLAQTPEIEVALPDDLAPKAEVAAERTARGVTGVRSVAAVVRGHGWLVRSGRVVPADLMGFEGATPPALPGIEGSGRGLYLSRTLASSWALRQGAVVEVVSPRPTLTPMGPQPRLRSLPLAGTYSGGRVMETERAALPLDVAESLLGRGRRHLLVDAGGLDAALALAPRLAAVLPAGSRVDTWKDLNRPLFFALRLERLFLFLGVSLIVVVASLALLADLALILANKREDMGMLLTLGATPRTLRRAFLLLGGLLALLGSFVGSVLGVGASLLFDRFRLIHLPGDVFFVDYIPFQVRPANLVIILTVTLGLAFAASFYGAGKAAALEPIEALRR